jgi:hypothetical protein
MGRWAKPDGTNWRGEIIVSMCVTVTNKNRCARWWQTIRRTSWSAWTSFYTRSGHEKGNSIHQDEQQHCHCWAIQHSWLSLSSKRCRGLFEVSVLLNYEPKNDLINWSVLVDCCCWFALIALRTWEWSDSTVEFSTPSTWRTNPVLKFVVVPITRQ